MDYQFSYLEACRICITCYPLKDMDFICLFLKNVEFQQELDFIQAQIKQWKLKIEEDDGLPQRICANCFAKFCSIAAFRRDCELAQDNLFQTISQGQQGEHLTNTIKEVQQTLVKEEKRIVKIEVTPVKEEKKEFLSQTDSLLPLVGGNYATGVNSSIEVDQQGFVASSTSQVVGLTDFPVFDQHFDHYDNPSFMDASATLLDNNLIDPTADFLPPAQNLFTFETAEPPSSGTLPLNETEIPSIISGIIDVTGANVNQDNVTDDKDMINDDLEDILQRSIIPTNSADVTATSIYFNKLQATDIRIKDKPNIPSLFKTETPEISQQVNKAKKQAISPLQQREENASDNECDESHVDFRLKGLPYSCHYCYCPSSGSIDHLSFKNDDALSQHFFDKHDPNRPYNCPQCPYSYKAKRLRDNHVRLVHEVNKTHKCKYCQKILRGSEEIHQYNCQHLGDWQCTYCDVKFLNTPLYRFRLHQRQHEKKNFKCRMCDRTFMRKAYLEAHERMHKSAEKTQWHCGQCNTNFSTDYDLRRHKYLYHNDERPVKCKECEQGFASIAFLQRHIEQMHNKDCGVSSSKTQHICVKCNLTFAKREGLQRHMREAVNNGQCLPQSAFNFKERRRIQRQGVFPCFLCPRRFHLRSQLDKHLNTHDERLRPFQCDQCGMRFRTVIELKQHVNVQHLNIKEFVCDKCGKSFGYKKDLRDHMLFHREIDVYCEEEGCEYVCKNDKALMDHVRHKHRQFTCEYCHEQFTRQKLTVHLRNVHRTEIDVELAGESDNFYKSQLLNNNNDITQISFNLLNTNTQTSDIVNKTLPSPTSSIASCCAGGAINGHTVTTTMALAASTTASLSTFASNSISSSSSSPMTSTTSSLPSSASACISLTTNNNNNNNKYNIHQSMQKQPADGVTMTTINKNNHYNHQELHQEMPEIYVTDQNSNNLDLNGFSNNSHHLNFVAHEVDIHDSVNMFLDSTSTSITGSNSNSVASFVTEGHLQFDQYFMASLMDTEQEIIVT